MRRHIEQVTCDACGEEAYVPMETVWISGSNDAHGSDVMLLDLHRMCFAETDLAEAIKLAQKSRDRFRDGAS